MNENNIDNIRREASGGTTFEYILLFTPMKISNGPLFSFWYIMKCKELKILAVKHYLKGGTSLKEVCETFEIKKPSLIRWIKQYQNNELIESKRESISYKVKKKHVKKAIELLNKNEQITMKELCKMLKNFFDDFDVTPQHLGKVIRDNNITAQALKRTRHEHFPNERRSKPVIKKEELKKFYDEIKKYSLGKIISIDETSINTMFVLTQIFTMYWILKKNDSGISIFCFLKILFKG